MRSQNHGTVSSLKNAWGRLRSWIKSGAADDVVRVTDEWMDDEEFDIHEALTPVGPSASFSTKVRRHVAHPAQRRDSAPQTERNRPGHVSSYAEDHHAEVRPISDALGNGMAARMLDSALGGVDDDQDDPQIDMHIIDAGELDVDLDDEPAFDLVRRRQRLSTHH